VLRGRVLFVDNNPDFRATRARFLHAHYHVLEAGSAQEAEQLLQEQWIHLAILDIRLEDDNDDKDISGLLLAQEEAYCLLPKIMLTSYPTVEAARAALGPALDGLPPAVDFLRKEEGPEALLRAIEDAFTRHVRINNALLIQANLQQPVTFPHLTARIEPGLTGFHLMERAEELEDLLRRLFYEQRQITLARLLWQCPGRVALVIIAFQEGALPESFVVVCGTQASMAETALWLPHLCSQGPWNDRYSAECADSHHALRGPRLRPDKCRPRTCAIPR
jgi:CheY-like chemotaxis protein